MMETFGNTFESLGRCFSASTSGISIFVSEIAVGSTELVLYHQESGDMVRTFYSIGCM